jgi:hypothetical protein
MSKNGYSDELERALARSDAHELCRQIDAFAAYSAQGGGEWPDELADDFGEIISCFHDDPNKAFAYVIIGASRTDDPEFLAQLECSPLEDLLRNSSPELLDRLVAEARKSPRFRWLLSNPFKVAVAPRVWEAIEKFRITGPHEEPSFDTLPPL